MILNIDNQNKLSEDDKKAFFEKAYYLSPLIEKIEFNRNLISIEVLTKKKSYKEAIKKKLISFLNKTLEINKRIDEKNIYKSKIKIKKKKLNPFNYLLKNEHIKKISSGIYSFEGKLLKLKNDIDKKFYNFAISEKYKDVHYSGIIPLDSAIKNSYIKSFPNHCLFVSNLKRNMKAINRVSKIGYDEKSIIKKNSDNPEYLLSPTVCFNCFENFQNSLVKKNLKITSISNCHRYESLNYKTFERLKIFSMRELIFFGNNKDILYNIEKSMNFFKNFFNNMKLEFKISSATDAFFGTENINKKIFQHSNDLKFELSMFLPYENKWLAVASFNNHLNTLTKAYNIKSKNSKTIYSGCVGVGYERLLYAIYSQRGFIKI